MKKTDEKLIREQYIRIYSEGMLDRTKARGAGLVQTAKNVLGPASNRASYTDTKASIANNTFISKLEKEIDSFNKRLQSTLGEDSVDTLTQTAPDLFKLYSNINSVINNIKQITNEEPVGTAETEAEQQPVSNEPAQPSATPPVQATPEKAQPVQSPPQAQPRGGSDGGQKNIYGREVGE